MTAPERIVDLIRHGETSAQGFLIGRSDPCLSVAGWRRMQARMRMLTMPADAVVVYSSPMRRCLRFARAFAESRGFALRVAADLRELDFGQWEMMEQARLFNDPGFQRFLRAPDRQEVPGGESFAAFVRRVSRWLAGLRAREGERHVLVLTHGGVMRVMSCLMLGLPWTAMARLHVPPAAHARFQLDGARARLYALNA